MTKPVSEWGLADLEALIGMEETSNLEFKDGRSLIREQGKKLEIAKDVSAMANAAGGVIVYGIHEANSVAESIAGCPAEPGAAEWFDQVITNNIEPKVQGVLIKRIDLPDDRLALVVEIPQAVAFAPHQSKPHQKYFRRYNTTIQAMLDHEVRDLMRRSSSPELYLKMIFVEKQAYAPDVARDIHFELYIGNSSSEPSLYTDVDVMVDGEFKPQTASPGWTVENMIFEGQRGYSYRRSLIVPDHMPIFKEREQKIMSLIITVRPNAIYWIHTIISAPGFRQSVSYAASISGDAVRASPTNHWS